MDAAFDYIIVGAGTAGCLLANRLSADPGVRVLLLEAGKSDAYHWIRIPVGYLYCIGNPRTDWMYFTEPDPGLNGRRLRYPRGKVLGGCSSINGMIYMRGQARDYDAWAELTGEDAWSWANALPDFMAHESHWRMDAGGDADFARFHGGARRVCASRSSGCAGTSSRPSSTACEQAGIPARADFNDGDNEGVGYFEVHAARRLALERRARLPAAGGGTPEPRASAPAPRSCASRCSRVPTAGSPAPGWCCATARPGGAAGGDPQRRRGEQPEAPATLRPRPRRPAAGARHRGRGRPARRRRQPPGPPADPQRLQGRRRADPERNLPRAGRQGADRAGIRAAAHRADEHGAEPARRLHPLRSRA